MSLKYIGRPSTVKNPLWKKQNILLDPCLDKIIISTIFMSRKRQEIILIACFEDMFRFMLLFIETTVVANLGGEVNIHILLLGKTDFF